MKKILRFFLLIGFILVLSSCSESEKVTDFIDEASIEADIRNYEKIDPTKLEIIAVLKGKEFSKANTTSVIINLSHISYSFNDGIFKEESGLSVPAELIYVKTSGGFKLDNIIYPKDGSLYSQTVRKMSRNDNMLMSKIDCYNEYGIINALAKKAEDLKLPDFMHKLETIPGINSEKVILPTEDKNVVEVGNLKDYNKEKMEEDHAWQYIDGVRFYINEGIAIESPVELVNHIELNKLKKDIEKYKKISPEKSEFIAIDKFSEFERNKEKHVILDLYWGEFSFKDGIFSIDSHYETIAKAVYNKSDELISFREAGSEDDFETALKEMTFNNEELLRCFEKKKDHSPDYVQALIEKAQTLGLHDLVHSPDDIPGYEEDCIEIPNKKRGVITYVKKSDYDACKNRLGVGESSYIKGLNYYSNAGIVIKSKVQVNK